MMVGSQWLVCSFYYTNGLKNKTRLNWKIAVNQRHIRSGWFTLRSVVYVPGCEPSLGLSPDTRHLFLSSLVHVSWLTITACKETGVWLCSISTADLRLAYKHTQTHADKYHLKRYFSSRGLKNTPGVAGKQTHSPPESNTPFYRKQHDEQTILNSCRQINQSWW